MVKILLLLVIITALIYALLPKKVVNHLKFLLLWNKKNKKILIEDTLKEIFKNNDKNNILTVEMLSQTFNISQKLMFKIVFYMSEIGLVKLEGVQISLTESGKNYALKIIRIHRLYEKYLAEKTGFNESEWHKLAERKEHIISQSEIEFIAKQLGNPLFDPHGHPIPTDDGKVLQRTYAPICTLKPNDSCQILSINDSPDIVYKQIVAENIYINLIVKIIENNDERIRFESDNDEFVLSPQIASNIFVEKIHNYRLNEKLIRLSHLKTDEVGEIVSISSDCRGSQRRRLLDLGFVKGSAIIVALENPLVNPKAYLVRGTMIALRNDQADYVIVKKIR